MSSARYIPLPLGFAVRSHREMMAAKIWTVGHSNTDLKTFLGLLEPCNIEQIADVRRFPGSRTWPHFNREPLEAALAERGIAYNWLPGLGGRRSSNSTASLNRGWRVAAFNAYADYMQTEPFGDALGELISLARARRTAMMCSERLPWRCHRRLIADALIVAGWQVLDILSPERVEPRVLTPFARIDGDKRIRYPSDDSKGPPQ